MAITTTDCTSPRQRRKAAQRAAKVLQAGGLVVFPTETVYGVAASVASAGGVQRLRHVKGRPDDQPFSVHIPDPSHVERYVDIAAQPALRRLVQKTLPGPITFIVSVSGEVMTEKLKQLGFAANQPELLYYQNTIGLRCPDEPVGQALLGCIDTPIVATSANLTGEPPATDAATAAEAFGDNVDLVLDGGACRHSRASTIVRIDGHDVRLLRAGVFDQRYLDKLMKRTLLFVCTGNTCRSPMAAALARATLADRLGVSADDLADKHVEVISAGVFAGPGATMTPEAQEALEELGVDPGAHRSQPLTVDLAQQADAIFGMTRNHVEAVRSLQADVGDKVQLLDPDGADIHDPVGGDVNTYVQCAQQIRQFTQQRLDALDW